MKIVLVTITILSVFQIIFAAERPQCMLYKNAVFKWWDTDCGNFCHQVGQEVTCGWWLYHMGCFCIEGYYRDRRWDCVPIEGCAGEYVPQAGNEAGAVDSPEPAADTPEPAPETLEPPTDTPELPPDTPEPEVKQRPTRRVTTRRPRTTTLKPTRKVRKRPPPPPPPIVKPDPECPQGEAYKKCGNRCKNLCESINNPTQCKYKKCDQGCFCKAGTLRNYNGACVNKDKCKDAMDSAAGKYQYAKSPSTSLWKKKNNTLIRTPKKVTCEKPEEYSTCGDSCVEKCENMYKPEQCPLTCQIGCFCGSKRFRNAQGNCVEANQCPGFKKKKRKRTTTRSPYLVDEVTTTKRPARNVSDSECPANEVATQCGSHCKELCENANFQGNCPPNMNCMQGCYCKDGYFRNKVDKCVPKAECGPALTTPAPPIKCKAGANEHYTSCGSKCSESCNVFNETVPQNCPPKCDEGCFCNQGFYRNRFGQCVPQDQCECEIPPQKCNGTNEEYLVCGLNCRPTCDNKEPDCVERCARGCFCKTGFIYNENGVCVEPKQCGKDIQPISQKNIKQIVRPGAKCPAEHEKWSKCGNLCLDFCNPKFDVDNCPMTCEKGCFCKKGYKRNAADQCVKVELCNDKPNCGPNQKYSDCGSNCGSRCKDIGRNIQCPLVCDKGCFCIDGYFRDEMGVCIPKDKCVIDTTPECGQHETYKNCSSHCGETCEDLLNPVECPKECEAGCFCDEDYYRGIDGNCGTKIDCNLPEPTTELSSCADNEVKKDCGNRCEESCEDSIKCTKTCEKGCFCINDYLRNKKGKCVVSENCKGPPQCAECKPNEYYTDCGTDCGRMCLDINRDLKQVCDKSTPCHAGCLCKFGFYRTPEGECVTKNECQFFINEDEQEIEYITTTESDEEAPAVVNATQAPTNTRVRKRIKKKKKIPKNYFSPEFNNSYNPHQTYQQVEEPVYRQYVNPYQNSYFYHLNPYPEGQVYERVVELPVYEIRPGEIDYAAIN